MSILNPHSGTSSLTGTNRGSSVFQSHERCCCCFPRRCDYAFTLIELLAVVLVLLVVTGITLGVVGYIQKRLAVQTTRAQIAAMEAALEAYKTDWGYYPRTTEYRVSALGDKERVNNALLYRALAGTCSNCSKKYLEFAPSQLRSVRVGGTNITVVGSVIQAASSSLTNIVDAWGTPFNYFNFSTNTYAVTTTNNPGYTIGGQINIATYDLWSYGADRYTHVPGVTTYSGWDYGPVDRNPSTSFLVTNIWMKRSAAADDIANFGP
ncbi:MAG: hypothetical protein PCFJNLEI_00957 [Verrucomicrobiae bacterium]|nr:hypothetical protein [Verrucomicrobiae bacterium]